MSNRDNAVGEKIVELAQMVGLKGFASPATQAAGSTAPNPSGSSLDTVTPTGEDSADDVLSLAQKVGLKGFSREVSE